MHYGIIFSVDTGAVDINDDLYWPVPEDAWQMTEDNESEYDCFRGTLMRDTENPRHRAVADDEEGSGWHYKWCTCLDQEQMDEFMAKMVFTSICNTLGALGMPQPDGAFCLGIQSAFAVETDDEAIVQAYVTPYLIQGEDEDTIPELKLAYRDGPAELTEDDWKIIMDWFAKKYEIN